MQYFSRDEVPPPAAFRGGAARQERLDTAKFMALESERLSQTGPPPRRFVPRDDEVLAELDRLFRGKCAFCETKTSPNLHLLRPAQEAEPLAQSRFAHLYYLWLRTDWANHYSACTACAMASRNQFPVSNLTRGALPSADELTRFANEDYGLWRWPHRDARLLLDPCQDRSFVAQLSFDLEGGVRAFTEKGAATIQVFQLDREPLAQARAQRFQEYVEVLKHELGREASNAFGFETMEFGGGWYLLLRRLLQRIGNRLDRTMRLGRDQVGKEIERVAATPLGRAALEAALEEIRVPVDKRIVRRPPVKGPPRRLTGVRLEDFKGVEKLEIYIPPAVEADLENGREAEAASLLVLGENAAGKSTILEAIALALADARSREQLRRPPESFILNPALMGSEDARAPASALVTLLFEADAELRLKVADRFDEAGAVDNLPPVFAYGAFRQYASAAPKRPRAGHVITLFRSDVVLPNPEAWLLGLPENEFAMVMRALQRILTIEGEIDVIQPDQANRRCLIVTEVGEGEDKRQIKTPLAAASSGFRSVLAMMCDVLQGVLARHRKSGQRSFSEVEGVLLIDEIEAHLHPRWKMQIIGALRAVLPKMTIIATTHDPLCLRGMHDGEVVVLNRAPRTSEKGDNEGVVVETLAELPNVEKMTIEQLLTSDFFSMFSTDSPAAELNVARLASLVARREGGEDLTAKEVDALRQLERQVLEALPLGSSEVQRLVLEAVSVYLERRREASKARLQGLRRQTRESIAKALENY